MCRVALTQCYNFRISKQDLLKRLNIRTVDDYVTKMQLRWAGHVTCMDFDRLLRKLSFSWMYTKLPVGAPENTYSSDLFKSLTSWH